jgi:hypothetical protein
VTKPPLIISNFEVGGVMFSNDRGSWNVSRALRDCKAGLHKLWLLDVAECYAANAACEVDEAKVAELMKVTGDFDPGIAVIEDGATWFIDGHHRLRVLHRRGAKSFPSYVIEEKDADKYRVLYNGKRKPPFKPY